MMHEKFSILISTEETTVSSGEWHGYPVVHDMLYISYIHMYGSVHKQNHTYVHFYTFWSLLGNAFRLYTETIFLSLYQYRISHMRDKNKRGWGD